MSLCDIGLVSDNDLELVTSQDCVKKKYGVDDCI